MKKFQKLALIAAMTATVAGAGMMVGCGSPAKEELGVYHYNRSEYRVIEQGKLMNGYSSVMVINSDNTFSATTVYDSYYSSDGETYSPVYYVACGLYGTYEVVSEDTDLGEKTVKITSVTALEFESIGRISSENFDEKTAEQVSSKLIGAEYVLDSAFKISEYIQMITPPEA